MSTRKQTVQINYNVSEKKLKMREQPELRSFFLVLGKEALRCPEIMSPLAQLKRMTSCDQS
jgi:hypothetical protein